MSFHNRRRRYIHLGDQAGFTITELLITFIVVLAVGVTFYTLFKSTVFSFITMQADASSSVQVNSQAYRLATVLRGATGITSADQNEIILYSYFYPSDEHVSLLRYYLQPAGGTVRLMADLTPMSANPPIGTPVSAEQRSFVIVENYHQAPGVSLFTYLDAGGNSITAPVSDLTMIKGVKVTVAAKTSNNAYHSQTVQVSIRNRKTNL